MKISNPIIEAENVAMRKRSYFRIRVGGKNGKKGILWEILGKP